MSLDRVNTANADEVQKLTAELDAANKELESLAYAVSHDLRAPLRAIEGFSDVILEDYKDRLDAEGQRFLNIIHSSSLKASRMIEGLLVYSRLGRHPISISIINTDEVVRNVLTDLRPVMGDAKVRFEIDALPLVRGDLALLREVWKNLLWNAVKFSRNSAEPKVEVRYQKEPGAHVFAIKDNGVGFDMKYAEKLFQLFQRLHGESEFEGVGVGLAVTRRLIARHGGKIWAEGTPDGGATFFFTLPE